jgi:poly(A) polymerase
MELLTAAGIKALPTGIEHGTVTAVVDGAHFEITTLRLDVKTHGRRAEVAFTDDWSEDAARRDLTINALSMTEDGNVYDPFGGLDDLAAGRVRFVGDAETRIIEDVLRLLRFFRFFAYYGQPPVDPEALAAAGKLAHLLPSLSGERVWAELRRLLCAPNPAAIFQLMADRGVLGPLLPGTAWIARLAALVEVEAMEGAATRDPLRRLAALVRLDETTAVALAERLRFSRKERTRLKGMTGVEVPMPPDAGPRQFRAAIYRLGMEPFRDVVFLVWAEARAKPHGSALDAGFAAAMDVAAKWPRPDLPIKGEDAVRLGLAPGPGVGRALERVEAWWIDEDFRPDRAACLQRLETLIGGDVG